MNVCYKVRCYSSNDFLSQFFDTLEDALEYVRFVRDNGFLVQVFKCTDERIEI